MFIRFAAGVVLVFACASGAGAAPLHVLLDSDFDQGSGSEVYSIPYASQADFIANAQGAATFSALDISIDYSLAGAYYDGQYHVILESDFDLGAGSEVYDITYATYADFLANNQAAATFSALDISIDYSLAGAYFDGQYHMVLESDFDLGAGSEVYDITYDSFADFLNNTQALAQFSALDISIDYSLGGVFGSYTPGGDGGPSQVPLPASGLLLLGGLGLLLRDRRAI